ncbi:Protein FAM3C Interleukin-like EMT inducer Precursor [Larimichthys crocea]|uniref:Protein FAM3C Interleukin-like EMT inducer n=2 Tax=Larimichthys crocea TaxID=215358 RepID=A0A6G0J4S3_LARCR|nr:Protein FAM3C Interleukin-like EMT inducer Precursor [Larimichthys crocea]
MRCRGVSYLAVVIVFLLITWGISMNLFDSQESTRNILGLNHVYRIKFETATSAPQPKCSLSKACPPDHFSLHIKSGAANVVGPKICFEGKTIMSHVLNNVGPGLNIVVVNGENGVVEKFGYLNMQAGNPEDILAYLTEIKPGMIVLVASFDDVTAKMTKEMREIFVGMGSTLITSVKRRDSWVFAGRTGTGNRSIYEKQAVNDRKNNIYEGWPAMVEIGACFPRILTAEH